MKIEVYCNKVLAFECVTEAEVIVACDGEEVFTLQQDVTYATPEGGGRYIEHLQVTASAGGREVLSSEGPPTKPDWVVDQEKRLAAQAAEEARVRAIPTHEGNGAP